MAAITTTAIGVLGAGYQIYKGEKDARDAKNALDNYQRQEFNNVAEGMQVSTLGADLQKEEQARLAYSQVDALQGMGARGVIGGLGRVEAGNQMVSRQIAADLDAQQKQIDQIRSQDKAAIRGMQEQREMQDIAGLSSQYNAGNQMMWQGIGGVAQSAMAGLGALGKSNANLPNTDLSKTSSTSTTNQITPESNGFNFYQNMGNIAKGFGGTTTNNYGQIPGNMGMFLQSQFMSPQNNLFQQNQ